MATIPTTHYGWGMPVDGGDFDNWGVDLNAVIQAVDTQVHANAATAAGYTDAAQAAAQAAGLAVANNLSDLGNLASALGNLGLTGTSGGSGWGGGWTIRIPVNIGGIVQGGVATTIAADSTTTVTYPTAFPNAVWGIYPSQRISAFDNTKDNVTLIIGTPTRTQAVLANNQVNGNATIDIPWWAVGY
jgi:hypothetical protein